MVEEVGLVMESRPGRAVVRIKRGEECEGCHACTFWDKGGDMVAEVENSLGASPGDTVRIQTGSQSKIKAAFLLYLFPLLMMFLGILGGQPLFVSLGLSRWAELLSVLSGLLLMAVSFAILYLASRRGGTKQIPPSRIVEILRQELPRSTP